MNRLASVAVVCLLAGCTQETPGPAELAMGSDLCANCRMVIVSQATAAQIVAPGEEPVAFDEVGCLRDYLARTPLEADAVAYVADHRTGAWIDARRALFTQARTATPMASGIIAHADAASRDADPAARAGVPVTAAAVLGGRAGGTP